MSVPYWRRSESLGQLRADVLIVGAGICGLSAAHELAARGLRPLIVERAHIGAGASSRNAGFLMRGMAENYAVAVRDHGPDLARTMWRWTEENLAINLSRGIGTLASFRPTPSCLLALDEGERAELHESFDMLRADGFEAVWLDQHDDSAWSPSGALGGLVNPGDASANPWEIVQHLARPLADAILERQELVGFESPPAGTPGILAHTTDATIHADRVLVCTNAYAGQLIPALTGLIEPNRGQMLAIRPDGPYRLDMAYYANRGSEYVRQTPDGTVVVGGKRTTHLKAERTLDDSPTPGVQSEIEAFARGTLGLRGRVVARWAGTMGFSRDALPIIGPVNIDGMERDGVWFCGGFTGHGMSLAARAAQAAIEQMLDGTPTPFGIKRFAG